MTTKVSGPHAALKPKTKRERQATIPPLWPNDTGVCTQSPHGYQSGALKAGSEEEKTSGENEDLSSGRRSDSNSTRDANINTNHSHDDFAAPSCANKTTNKKKT